MLRDDPDRAAHIILIAQGKGFYIKGLTCKCVVSSYLESIIAVFEMSHVRLFWGCNRASLHIRKYFVGPTLSPPLVYLEDLHCLPDAAS